MAFCQNCGNKLNPEAKFCPECGEPVVKKDMTKRKIKFAGEIIKCPNCGEIMDAFCSRCSACGYELRNSDSSELRHLLFMHELNSLVVRALTAFRQADNKKLCRNGIC